MRPEFKPNEKLAKAREALYELFASKERGDLVTHEEIEKLTGFARNDRKRSYYEIVDKVGKRHESDRGISIISQPGLGYSLATTQEQFAILPGRNRRAIRQARRGCKSVEALPDHELSPHQSRLKDAMATSSHELIKSLSKSNQLNDYLLRRKPGEPLRIRFHDDEQNEEKTG